MADAQQQMHPHEDDEVRPTRTVAASPLPPLLTPMDARRAAPATTLRDRQTRHARDRGQRRGCTSATRSSVAAAAVTARRHFLFESPCSRRLSTRPSAPSATSTSPIRQAVSSFSVHHATTHSTRTARIRLDARDARVCSPIRRSRSTSRCDPHATSSSSSIAQAHCSSTARGFAATGCSHVCVAEWMCVCADDPTLQCPKCFTFVPNRCLVLRCECSASSCHFRLSSYDRVPT